MTRELIMGIEAKPIVCHDVTKIYRCKRCDNIIVDGNGVFIDRSMRTLRIGGYDIYHHCDEHNTGLPITIGCLELIGGIVKQEGDEPNDDA